MRQPAMNKKKGFRFHNGGQISDKIHLFGKMFAQHFEKPRHFTVSFHVQPHFVHHFTHNAAAPPFFCRTGKADHIRLILRRIIFQ